MHDIRFQRSDLRSQQLLVHGAVQGIGFRPFVYRLAHRFHLTGYVRNTLHGVLIIVEGPEQMIQEFTTALKTDCPPLAKITCIDSVKIETEGFTSFQILESDVEGNPATIIQPDIATCPECLKEIFDPKNRRYHYPFTNCTHCGPRYSIITSLPYDRVNTTMTKFTMCDACRTEYENPLDRRFHAQPNACPKCGPHVELWNSEKQNLSAHYEAVLDSADKIRKGSIIALKGIGGFQLLADARNIDAVHKLRERKHRPHKPFALMYPSMEAIRNDCIVSGLEEQLLSSFEAPIALLQRKHKGNKSRIVDLIAPGNSTLGIMLPYSPLHHLLMTQLEFPIIATSGNLSGEPLFIDELDACDRLGHIADYFLVHNRPIARHVDDSILRVMAGVPCLLRRARGFAPLPISIPEFRLNILAVGPHLKNSIALSSGKDCFISQYIGDMETARTTEVFEKTITNLKTLYNNDPVVAACDMHPDYVSTNFAKKLPGQHIEVQHHYAHVLSCMAEHGLTEDVLGVAWDGTGYGTDHTVWGGEFLDITHDSYIRTAHFKTFFLPGGDKAVVEPRRAALGLLYAYFGNGVFSMNNLPTLQSFSREELDILKSMLENKINTVVTSSAGRIFDAVASISGLRQITTFEGQAAIELECIAAETQTDGVYEFVISDTENGQDSGVRWIIDIKPMIQKIINDVQNNVPRQNIAARFHNTMATIILEISKRSGKKNVVLTGGVFQNKYLTERAIDLLRENNFKPYWHQRVPSNDGGISLGQIVAAARAKR